VEYLKYNSSVCLDALRKSTKKQTFVIVSIPSW
jgi:hypothetical protein